MFPQAGDLKTESDVEQKLLWPLLTSAFPEGLDYSAADIATKLNIKRLEIGKGASRKTYFPDYLIVLAGLPVMVIEAKAPNESLSVALDEARLYGNEVNALYPHSLNPVQRVIACNGIELCSAPLDTATPDVQVSVAELAATNINFARFVELCRRTAFQASVDSIRRRTRKDEYRRPVTLVGGDAFQNEELPQNTFGATIAGDYGHIFNPKSREDRALIARHAYIPSLRRQRYIEPIDRVIRNAVAPIAAKVKPIEDSSKPHEITSALRERKKLEITFPKELTERLYVGNLPYSMTLTQVRELFRAHGFELSDAYLMVDKATRKSRGAGFVTMPSRDDAVAALGALNGTFVEGRRITVRPADPREEK